MNTKGTEVKESLITKESYITNYSMTPQLEEHSAWVQPEDGEGFALPLQWISDKQPIKTHIRGDPVFREHQHGFCQVVCGEC